MSLERVNSTGQTGMTVGRLTVEKNGTVVFGHLINGPSHAGFVIRRTVLPSGEPHLGVHPAREIAGIGGEPTVVPADPPVWWSQKHALAVQTELLKRAPYLNRSSNPWPRSVIKTSWKSQDQLDAIRRKEGVD